MTTPEKNRGSSRIRPARIENAAGIARLATELGYAATAAEMASRLAVLLKLPHHFIAVAEGHKGLLGCVAVEKRLLLVSSAKAELMALIVAPAARRGGVGRTLVHAAKRWALAQGLDTIVVRSNIARTESHPFYERIGYTRHKTQHVHVKTLPNLKQETHRVPQKRP